MKKQEYLEAIIKFMRWKHKALKEIDFRCNLMAKEDYEDIEKFLYNDLRKIYNHIKSQQKASMPDINDCNICPHCILYYHDCYICSYGEKHGICNVDEDSNYDFIRYILKNPIICTIGEKRLKMAILRYFK